MNVYYYMAIGTIFFRLDRELFPQMLWALLKIYVYLQQ